MIDVESDLQDKSEEHESISQNSCRVAAIQLLD